MKESIPKIRVYARNGHIVIREGLSSCFYMKRPHMEIARDVLKSLDVYLGTVGEQQLHMYADDEGEWQTLNDKGWEQIRHELLEQQQQRVLLWGSAGEEQYRFEYHGRKSGTPLLPGGPDELCALGVWLPTDHLEEHGPGRFRELVLGLAAALPFCSGHAGLAFQCETDLVGVARKLGEYCFRYPGMDIPDLSYLSRRLGNRLRGPTWMTFLGPPVLGELGGAEGLRARLSSPGTTVQELDTERAIVTLGPWPEAGDTEQGRTLPAYRELARVLEPWLYREEPGAPYLQVSEETRRWERRFLD